MTLRSCGTRYLLAQFSCLRNLHRQGKSDEWKKFDMFRGINRMTWDTRHLYRGLCIVYSQHWLLFTGSHRHNNWDKWLLQFMTSVSWHQCHELRTAQLTECKQTFAIHKLQTVRVIMFPACCCSKVFSGLCISIQQKRNEMKITWLKRSVALTSKHFCHQHCGIHIKRSTFRYLFTSFGLKVRVFP